MTDEFVLSSKGGNSIELENSWTVYLCTKHRELFHLYKALPSLSPLLRPENLLAISACAVL